MPDRSSQGRTSRARGTQRERAVAALMRADGWVVGSMRTSAGGGDLIASRGSGPTIEVCRRSGADSASCGLSACENGCDVVYPTMPEVRLVEVKSTSRPFERFGPRDRLAMKVIAEQAGATAWLAHWPKNGELRWIPESDWPS